MGFGSYDESEQRDPDYGSGEGDEEDVDLHKHDHEGSNTFENGASTEDLVDRLAGIKDDEDESEE